jgi:beta-galactosidase
MTDYLLHKPVKLRDWRFKRADDAGWGDVELPHSPFVAEPDGQNCWLGICHYERRLKIENPDPDSRYTLYFQGAMHSAIVSVDGNELARHTGGYLPFEVDLGAFARDGREHLLSVELDNRDNPDVPPGKPLSDLDFCWYGGLYRDVELRRYPPVCITDPVAAGEKAGGGVFIRTIRADKSEAELSVFVNVRNSTDFFRRVVLRTSIKSVSSGAELATSDMGAEIGPRGSVRCEMSVIVERPALWSPESPNLHYADVSVFEENGTAIDIVRERFGIRRVEMSRSGGLRVNGARIRPRGTNRHQDHPYIGYALPAAAQKRDAIRIKRAGFDYVRLSHYPQSPDFLDACDELGILVMNAIPGWQFFGGEKFVEACRENARDLVRRDRNHPCVILWELSLNETSMPQNFIAEMNHIGHEEYPGDQMFTCGWVDGYDVYVHARQHGQIHKWKEGDRAMVVSEYGDWEYYASNEGFDQKTKRGLLDSERNSRALRGDGENKMLRQAANFAEALDDTLSCPAITDGQWLMFDYPRGYDQQRASCGTMDIFRLPKFAYYFYASQCDAGENVAGSGFKPMVFVASNWIAGSSPDITVFSNCDEVKLSLNGRSIGRKKADPDGRIPHLPHPPFHFEAVKFAPGTLEAVGYINGKAVASHKVITPGEPVAIKLDVDLQNLPTATSEPDAVFVRASIVDEKGVVCVGDVREISLKLNGEGWRVAGPDAMHAEAGIASFLVLKSADAGSCEITARAENCATVPAVIAKNPHY